MSISKVIQKAYEYNKSVGRKFVYIAVDIHDTLAESNYCNKMPKIIPEAAEAIKQIQVFPEIVLILYSSSYNHEAYLEYFRSHGLNFKYFNENPEVGDTATGDFSKKFFYNALIDDKAGFELREWVDVVDAVGHYRIGFHE